MTWACSRRSASSSRSSSIASTRARCWSLAAVRRRIGLRQRMLAPRLGVAAHQGVGGRVEKQRLDDHAHGCERAQPLGNLGQGLRAAHVHGDGHALVVALLLQLDEGQQQLGRQVVDAVVACILDRMQGHGLARSRHAGDEYEFEFHGVFVAVPSGVLLRGLQHFLGVRHRGFQEMFSAEHTGNFGHAGFALHNRRRRSGSICPAASWTPPDGGRRRPPPGAGG